VTNTLSTQNAQVVPIGGVSGNLMVMRGLTHRGVPAPVAVTALKPSPPIEPGVAVSVRPGVVEQAASASAEIAKSIRLAMGRRI